MMFELLIAIFIIGAFGIMFYFGLDEFDKD